MTGRMLKITWDGKNPHTFAVRDAATDELIHGIFNVEMAFTPQGGTLTIVAREFVVDVKVPDERKRITGHGPPPQCTVARRGQGRCRFPEGHRGPHSDEQNESRRS